MSSRNEQGSSDNGGISAIWTTVIVVLSIGVLVVVAVYIPYMDFSDLPLSSDEKEEYCGASSFIHFKVEDCVDGLNEELAECRVSELRFHNSSIEYQRVAAKVVKYYKLYGWALWKDWNENEDQEARAVLCFIAGFKDSPIDKEATTKLDCD